MKRRKPVRPRKATHAPRFHVSVSAGTCRAMQVAAVRRGVTLGVLVEEACGVVDCCDCQAEKAF